MPRYHFHFIDGASEPDLDGVIFDNDDAAHAHAVRLAVAREVAPIEWTLAVSDESMKTLFHVTPGGKRLLT